MMKKIILLVLSTLALVTQGFAKDNSFESYLSHTGKKWKIHNTTEGVRKSNGKKYKVLTFVPAEKTDTMELFSVFVGYDFNPDLENEKIPSILKMLFPNSKIDYTPVHAKQTSVLSEYSLDGVNMHGWVRAIQSEGDLFIMQYSTDGDLEKVRDTWVPLLESWKEPK
jgi:hypothetical protein